MSVDRNAEQPQSEVRATFKPFEWAPPSSRAGFAGRVHDIAAGAHLVMQLLEHDRMERETSRDPRPIFGPNRASVLERLAIVALDMLVDEADREHTRAMHAPAEP